MQSEKKFTIKCRGIILYEDKLLVVRHKDNNKNVALPGGHLEWGESVLDCIKREIVEELGVEPKIGRLLYINTYTENDSVAPVEFFFEITNGKDFLGCESKERSHAFELDEILWIDKDSPLSLLPQKIMEGFREGSVLSDTTKFIS